MPRKKLFLSLKQTATLQSIDIALDGAAITAQAHGKIKWRRWVGRLLRYPSKSHTTTMGIATLHPSTGLADPIDLSRVDKSEALPMCFVVNL